MTTRAKRPAKRKPKGRASPELLDQQPPCDLDAERGVIGSIILDPNALDRVAPIVRPDHFYHEAHCKLYGHLLAMRNGSSGAIDELLLKERLKQAGDLEAIGGAAYLAEVAQSVPVAAHAEHYAKIIREKSGLRTVVHTAEQTLVDAQSGVMSLADVVQRARIHLDRAGDAAEAFAYNPISAAELVTQTYDIRFLVEKILVAGQPFILAGPKKSLKTTLLLDLGISLAVGGFFLGKFRVPEAVTVGLMTGESGLATIQETVKRICRKAGCDPSGIGNLHITDKVPQFASAEHLDAVRRFIMESALDVLIVDPVYMCLDGADASNLFIQGALLRSITEVCQQRSVTLVLCHHTKKGIANPSDPPELEHISWAGFQEFARQWLLVSRREVYVPGTGEHRLWMSVGGSIGHGGLWGLDISEGNYLDGGGRVWQVDVVDADDVQAVNKQQRAEARKAESEKRLEADRRKLVNTMAKFPDGETEAALRAAAGFSSPRFKAAVESILKDQDAVRCDVAKGNRKTPYPGYKLAER